MNLQEHIKKVLREEDFIPLEDLNTVIKDYEGGFDVFIMNGDKKIGEISFVKENLPDLYTIVDATIDDEYKGNRIYPKTIINLFKERPNIIINSVFRSPEAEKAWRYILSNLPSNIGKSVKYYKEEDTTLYQLKLRNIQENIRKILKEELNNFGSEESFTGVTPMEITQQLINKPVKLVGDVNTTTIIQNVNINRDGSVNIAFQNGLKINSSIPMLRKFNFGVSIPLEFKVKNKK
jgi:hypothetical protein